MIGCKVKAVLNFFPFSLPNTKNAKNQYECGWSKKFLMIFHSLKKLSPSTPYQIKKMTGSQQSLRRRFHLFQLSHCTKKRQKIHFSKKFSKNILKNPKTQKTIPNFQTSKDSQHPFICEPKQLVAM